MNISVGSILEFRRRDGDAADDRPAYVGDALDARVEVSYRQGRPVVPPTEGRDSDLTLGDSGSYGHYVTRTSLLRPDAGDFLAELFASEHINSLSDASNELRTDEATIRKAADLHSVDVPRSETGGSDESEIDTLTLPSGEELPFEILTDDPWRDKLVLVDLLCTCGMSLDEASAYLSYELPNADPSVTDLRRAARECDLLASDDETEALDPDEIEHRISVESGSSVPQPPEKRSIDQLAREAK